uniref:RNase H type-1 domain-containing protein n=1 Tax=Quercus lobata TaxID=97700 RepID=A0A7N2L366_QUELO
MLRIPSKVKHFAWRACNDALPTMVNHLCRHIVASDVCEVYNSLPEDTLNAIWGCKELEVVWRQLSWAYPATNPPPGDFSSLLSDAIICALVSLPSLCHRSSRLQEACCKISSASKKRRVKLSRCQAQCSGAHQPHTSTKPILMELCFEAATLLAWGDAAVVIQAINCGSVEFSSYGHIIDDITHHSFVLTSSEFCFVNRSCNKVADVLAKKAKSGLELQVRRDDMPGEIALLVFADIC